MEQLHKKSCILFEARKRKGKDIVFAFEEG